LSGDAGYAVYIMASRRNGTLYVGVTNDIARRAYEHRNRIGAAFTRKYDITQLVWYGHYADVNEAIAREKQLKKWERAWKLKLIEAMNPDWVDLYETLNN
jgi:putative endonuclease